MTTYKLCLTLALGSLSVSAAGQSVFDDASSSTLPQAKDQQDGIATSARTGETGVGEVGQRIRTFPDSAAATPLTRLNTRIQNRVENRLENRIDRNYTPSQNAGATIETAAKLANSQVKPR